MDDQKEMTSKATVEPHARQKPNVGRIVGFTLAGLAVVVVLSVAAFGLVSHPSFTASLRDISIIVLALVTVVIGLLLSILIYQLQSLTALMRDEIKPVLESANQTARAVRGTTAFVSDAVVTPIVAAASYASAVRQAISVLGGGKNRRTRRSGDGRGPKRIPGGAPVPGSDGDERVTAHMRNDTDRREAL